MEKPGEIVGVTTGHRPGRMVYGVASTPCASQARRWAECDNLELDRGEYLNQLSPYMLKVSLSGHSRDFRMAKKNEGKRKIVVGFPVLNFEGADSIPCPQHSRVARRTAVRRI